MTFADFGPKALPFFKALEFHQSREWFEANRKTYESARQRADGRPGRGCRRATARSKNSDQGRPQVLLVPHPSRRALLANKDPYKTNSGVVLTRSGNKNDPGLLYFHLSPEECFFAAGFYLPDPDKLARLRAAAGRDPRRSRR